MTIINIIEILLQQRDFCIFAARRLKPVMETCPSG